MRHAVLALFLTATPAAADPLETARTCAAFWLGRDDYARRSDFLDENPGDVPRAAAFRAVAVRLSGDQAGTDAFLADERRVMARLMWAVIAGDRTSNRLHESILDRCEDFAATQLETRGLR